MKIRINNLLLILAVILCSLNYSFAQDDKILETPKLNKNSIYGNVGIGGLYFTATGYYERMLDPHLWNTNISSFLKVGLGAEAHWGIGGPYVLAQYGLITGTGVKKHHFETGIGVNYFLSGDLEGDQLPLSGFVGWRFQKPEKKFLFRMGAGWPEAIYFGVGASF